MRRRQGRVADMTTGLGYESEALEAIFEKANTAKNECFFVGFAEGILASDRVEASEVEPLIAECEAICRLTGDEDAREVVREASAGHTDPVNELLELLTLIIEHRLRGIDSSCPRSSANRLLGFCAGVNCDARVTEEEAQNLLERLNQRTDLSDDPRIDALRHELVEALQDEVITQAESDRLGELISALVGDSYAYTGIPSSDAVPVVQDMDDVSPEILEGAGVLVTGGFAFGTRRQVLARLEEFGATIQNSASRKVDIVIIGAEGSPHYAFKQHGGKLAKVLKYRKEGPVPRIYVEMQIKGVFD